MTRIFTFLVCFFTVINLNAQLIADWEDYSLGSNEAIKDAGDEGGFNSKGIFVNNEFFETPSFSYWSGWILSSGTDTTTPGFMNEHSVISGIGNDNSSNYAVSYAPSQTVMKFTNYPKSLMIDGFYINNSTYAYLSMQNGDSHAKKFGGEDGDDPDFFSITIKGMLDGNVTKDSVLFYLADYRSSNNDEDYIVKDWTYLDVSKLGICDSLLMTLNSSDVGEFGMNTPAYFCIDDVHTSHLVNTTAINDESKFTILLNQGELYVNSSLAGSLNIFDLSGKLISTFEVQEGGNSFTWINSYDQILVARLASSKGIVKSTLIYNK